MSTHNPGKPQQIVMLGASNLTIGWQALLETLRQTVRGPMDLRVALGMGRSYLEWSGFWARRLPGILQSELWDSLPSSVEQPPLALLTDIGNDVVYERTPEEIFDGVRQCVRRLKEWHPETRIVMTGLPLESVSSIGPVHYRIARTILFPGCRLPLETIVGNSESVDQLCREFAQQNDIPWLKPKREWYGVDPIHVLPRFRQEAFRLFFANWFPSQTHDSSQPESERTSCRLPKARLRTLFGIRRTVAQPTFNSPQLIVSAY